VLSSGCCILIIGSSNSTQQVFEASCNVEYFGLLLWT
jgi:hypothetical protein